jgi:uncharacterized membrane protein (DUF373 family)
MRKLRRLLDDAFFLHVTDRGEQMLAKLLGGLLLVVTVVAAVQMVVGVGIDMLDPRTRWVGDRLTFLLGDLLNLLIALEVLQNITSYLRRRVVQIELVLLTAITAVARKVIVLPPGAENKPELLFGLGIAVLCLSAAYWLVRLPLSRSADPRKEPARSNPARDPSPPADGGGGG